MDILIVEDNDELAEVLLDFLVAEGYEAEIAGNGYEALEFFLAHSPRLVILDIMLPGMDGFTVCTEIRRLSDVPVIIVSARGEKTDMLDGLGLGAGLFYYGVCLGICLLHNFMLVYQLIGLGSSLSNHGICLSSGFI